MKPIKLTLEAFGTFADKVEIDFTKLSKDGVFLISGETGSGKTTIFDAICYAIYGKANGQDREPRNFRSQFADPSQDTYVNLVFECNGKQYEVQRSPEYTKYKTLKNGEVRESKKASEVYLVVPNAEPIKKDSNVSKALDEILGISCEQFRQTVMIAQGEFKRFLLANSEDKGKILNTMFGTQRYGRFIEVLKVQRDRDKSIYLEQLNAVVSDILSISYDTTWEYAQEFEYWKTSNAEDRDVEKVLPYLKQYVSKLSAEKLQLEDDIGKLKSRIDSMNVRINAYDAMNHNIENRNRLANSLKELQSQQDDIDAVKAKLLRLDVAKSIERDYTSYTKSSQGVKQLQSRIDAISVEIQDCQQSIQGLSLRKMELSSILQRPFDTIEDLSLELNTLLVDLNAKLLEVKSQGTEVKAVIDSISVYKRELATLGEHGKQLAIETDEKARLEQQYSNSERLYNLNVAGILAEQLQDGMPCMVCGSTHHPKVAVKCQEAPSKGQLELLKQELERYQNDFRVFQTDFLLERQRCEHHKEDVLKNATRFNVHDDSLEGVESSLTVVRESLVEEYKALSKKIASVTECIRRLKEIDTSITDYKDRSLSLLATKSSLSKLLDDSLAEYKSLKDVYHGLLEANHIASEYEYLELLRQYQHYESLSSRVANFEDTLRDYSSRIDEYDRTIGDRTFMDTEYLKESLAIHQQNYRDYLQRYSIVSHMFDTDSAVYDRVAKNVKPVVEKYQRYRDTDHLLKVANGTVSGMDSKVAFDNYAQAYYFEKVILSANQKIDILSNGRYSLVRTGKSRSKRVKGGLDVEVFDAYTGMTRVASTLSGGESFMASLSLALGLSEVVQQQSGGIKIDAMFIDEGFGTLDSNQSLQQAIKVIDSLATNDRMIGIISHVNELQEHFTNRLVVEKSKCGSRIVYSR